MYVMFVLLRMQAVYIIKRKGFLPEYVYKTRVCAPSPSVLEKSIIKIKVNGIDTDTLVDIRSSETIALRTTWFK